jgi:FkbM family methyltransferase
MIRKLSAALRWAANHPMRRGSKWNAVCSFIQAQVGARMILGDLCVPLPKNTHLLVPPRMKGSVHAIWPGVYEFEGMSFILHFLRPGELFIDAGANIGVFTVLASGVVGARTIAFEPGPLAYQFLARNILLNNLSALASARNLALGKVEGRIRFTSGLGTENRVAQANDSQATVEVPLSTLDAQLKGLEPAIIKIDVEGFEPDVLAGGLGCLAKLSLRALIIERVGNADKFGQDEALLHQRIRDWGFVPYTYVPETRTLNPVAAECIGNIIYVRDQESAATRLRQAPAYQFAGRSI